MNYRLASGNGRFFKTETPTKSLVVRTEPIKNLLNTITDRIVIAQEVVVELVPA